MLTITTPDGTEIGVDLKTIVTDSLAALTKVHGDIKRRQFISWLTRLGVENTLAKIIKYLIEDRVTEEPGTGGWSKTASKYVELIYGTKAANAIYESMTDTALAVEAIKSFEHFINYSHRDYEIKTLDDSLREYLDKRWNSQKGDAGTLKSGTAGFHMERDHLRHTAMIARIFGQIPELRRNLGKTAEYLNKRILEMNANDWQGEKIATPVAVYVAIKNIEKYGKYLSLEAIDKIKQITIDETISRYDSDMKGWHSGPFKEVALSFYTLFLLAEMPEIWLSDSILRKQMEESLKSLLGLMIHSPHGYGLPVYGMSYPDIGLSCLMISALLQKPVRNRGEEDSLLKLIEFVVKGIESGEQQYWANTYSWTVSYFVRDVCKVLTDSK